MKIRINTEQVRDVGQQLRTSGDQIQDLRGTLQGAINNLDTWAWDGRSRADAEPILDQIRPQGNEIMRDLDNFGRMLERVASQFENHDENAVNTVDSGLDATGFIYSPYGGGLYGPHGGSVFGPYGPGFDPDDLPYLMNATVAATYGLSSGYGVVLPEWVEFGAKSSADLWFNGNEKKLWPTRIGAPHKNRKEQKLRLSAFGGELWQAEGTDNTYWGPVRFGGKTEAVAGDWEAGAGLNVKEGKGVLGLYAGGTAFTAAASGVIGSTDFGLGGEARVNAGKVDAFVGFEKGKGAGAKIGGSLVSAEGTVGMNVAGKNVGLTGEIGVKFEIGFVAGPEARVYLGPFTVGLNIGDALGS